MQIPAAFYKRQPVLLSHMVMALLFIIFSISSLFDAGAVYAQEINHTVHSLASCTGTPDANSLLAVILDRSGSLIAGPAPTDEDGYSTSATKALADLWPGQIAVIPFGSDASGNDHAPILGPYAHSNTEDIKNLKAKIDAYPPFADSDTPLGLAMQNAQALFQQPGVTPCSKIVLITDGQPTGPQGRENEVRTTSASWFKQQGIPINVFGLKIDKSTPDGRDADNLLQTLSIKTGGKYDSVQSAQDLGREIIGLYATWRHLDFTSVNKDPQNGNYPVVVDSRTSEATIITFHSNGGKNSPLVTKSGQTIPKDKLFTTTDVHYEIDRLLPPIQPDTYIVNSINDPAVTVYRLIASSLQLKFAPMASVAYTGQSFTIAAHFINTSNGEPIIPAGNAPFRATVSESIHGKIVATSEVDLAPASQGSDIFTGKYAIPSYGKPGKTPVQIGSISLKVVATYQDATRATDEIIVPVAIPQTQPVPPPHCYKGVFQCFWIEHSLLITDIGIPLGLLLILLMLFLLWRRQPQPVGYLQNKNATIEVDLKKRRFANRLFHRSTVTSEEIQVHRDALGRFNFGTARFGIRGTRSGEDYLLVARNSGVPVEVKTRGATGMQRKPAVVQPGNTLRLNNRDVIVIENREEAIYTTDSISNTSRTTRYARHI